MKIRAFLLIYNKIGSVYLDTVDRFCFSLPKLTTNASAFGDYKLEPSSRNNPHTLKKYVGVVWVVVCFLFFLGIDFPFPFLSDR